ncbi:hypothetical protein BV20DRAFT_1035909 [Pilatotrama ljubarskyi]|nr:hypothetical protein BV20DRAFT_1035909 [Pilatotrama ljubarskyi]
MDEEDNYRCKPRTSGYHFCPAPHCLLLLRLFAKHACQHSLLPERHGKARSAEDICQDAVNEMYHDCYRNNLADVWAYLWSSWSSRPCWKLWARSAYAVSIPQKHTTMVVEALWWSIKHFVLHRYNHPPIDLTLYAIITKTLPHYRLTLQELLEDSCKG